MKRTFLAVGFIVISFLAANAMALVPAFPGAEGFGAYALGGRGGDVYHVTNLNNTGAGSLRYGITSATGPRTIVFDVSGTIALASVLDLNKSYITIAGQTAPGDGICIRDHRINVKASNLVIRYIRSRLGDESLTEEDGIWIQNGSNIIMDHISSSWSVDEVFSCSTDTNNPILTNVTVQWSIISEALNDSIHGKGTHGYGALIRGCYDAKYTYHHNLWAHNASRNPRPGNYDTNPYTIDPCGLLFDFRNNVIYNWLGSRPGYDADTLSVCRYNYVGNWAKAGVNGSNGYLYSAQCKYFRGYYAGNYFNGTYAADNWAWVYWSGSWTLADKVAYKMSVPFPAGTIATDTALVAYQRVLGHAGTSLPKRDSVDTRVVNDVINGTGQIIDTQGQVGGWPTLNSLPAPTDTDQDGMPDAWETANGLSPTYAADRNYYTFSTDYTNLEVYLNSLVPNGTYDTDVTPPTPDQMTWQNVPAALSETQINMTATTATDPWGVEYYFANLIDPNHNSGWQNSTTYTDTGLAQGSVYTYTVKARDKSPAHNETADSNQASATTLTDTTPPEPNLMTFDVAPHELDINSIAMVATTATDLSGVEYYFANITDPNHDSGWQDNTDYTDTGLTNNTTYSYSVIARDKSSSQNETAWSNEANATTVRYTCSGDIISDLDENCKVDFMDYRLMASHWNETLPLNNNIAVNGTFDTDIIPGWQIFDLPSAVGDFIAIYDGYAGNPVGSAAMSTEPMLPETGTNGHYFYQVIPVEAGDQYKLSAEWTGDLSGFGYIASDPCNRSNWVQVLVAFETNADANTWTVWTDANAVMYGKTFGVANQNIDSSGAWLTWEPITASQTNGPADGVFTASGDYMVVAFGGGSLPWSGGGYFSADNVKVEGPECSTIDLNGDCSLDWLDILKFAQDWLSCNRNPASECMLP